MTHRRRLTVRRRRRFKGRRALLLYHHPHHYDRLACCWFRFRFFAQIRQRGIVMFCYHRMYISRNVGQYTDLGGQEKTNGKWGAGGEAEFSNGLHTTFRIQRTKELQNTIWRETCTTPYVRQEQQRFRNQRQSIERGIRKLNTCYLQFQFLKRIRRMK